MSATRLIVGLGNPGKKYTWTRHNIGFMIVARLAEEWGIPLRRSFTMRGILGQGELEQQRVALFLPQTFMNNSGVAVGQVVKKKFIGLENILVACDDLNLPFGQLRVRARGSAGGHNGLSSIIERLRTEEFARLRVGIGRPAADGDVVDFVLSEFSKAERSQLDGLLSQAADCCRHWVKEGTEQAMNHFNRRIKNEQV